MSKVILCVGVLSGCRTPLVGGILPGTLGWAGGCGGITQNARLNDDDER